MKIKQGLSLRHIGTNSIVIPDGSGVIDFDNIISLNATAAFLWNELQHKEFDNEEVVQLLVQRYGLDIDTARCDVADLLEKWIKTGIIEV